MNRKDCLDSLMKREIAEKRIGGAHVCIYHQDHVVYEKAYGYAPDAIYRMYSMTKPITAVAAMILYERGQLDLLSPISEYLPEFTEMTVIRDGQVCRAEQPILVEHLLNMTSGIVYPDADPAGQKMDELFRELIQKLHTKDALTTRELARRIAQVPLAFEPGTQFRYGLSADIMGALIEVIDGRPYDQFCREEIFDKLGMRDTDFYVPEKKMSRLVDLHYPPSMKEAERPEKFFLGVSDGPERPAYIAGGAGLHSTMHDYLQFAKMLLKGGTYEGGRLISEQTLEFFVQNRLSAQQKSTIRMENLEGYGYGSFMRVHEDPVASGFGNARGAFGWDGWTGPRFEVDRKNERVFLFLTQTPGYMDLALLRKATAIANAL